ncbi:MAG TPA: Rnase Y domain-containing protein, partial [Lacipirellulaceae bacterium]|nr:Rnase Y domain-containing protein [Lacipirellulaceae bacterium]
MHVPLSSVSGAPLPLVALSDGATLALVSAIAAAMGMGVVKLLDYLRKRDADKEAAQIIERAEVEASARRKEAAVEAREMALQEKARLEAENEEIRRALHDRERKLDKSEDALQSRADQLAKQEKMVESNQRRLAEKLDDAARRQKELDDLLDLERQTMHQLSGLTREEAETRLLSRLEKELIREQGALIAKYEREAVDKTAVKAKEMLITTLQRYAASHTAESTTSTVDIPNDEMKGRIIGREGRNIRALEKATGVDVIIDDTPGVVIVSAFDPVRREIARISLGKLIADGRIHPSRIEELVAETEREVEAEIKKFGEEALQEAQVFGVHPKVVELLGRLRYRTSYSQNVLRHSIEVSFITGMLAEEMGLDGELARRAGLLHDIGKAADHEMEG